MNLNSRPFPDFRLNYFLNNRLMNLPQGYLNKRLMDQPCQLCYLCRHLTQRHL